MAELRLRVVGAPPSGPGWAGVLRAHVRPGDVITSSSDRRFRAAADVLSDIEDLEYSSLIDLVGRFLDMMGLTRGRIASPSLQMAAVAELCEGLSEESPLYLSRRHRGLHRLASETMSEFRKWGLDGVYMAALIPDASETLSAKLSSLSHLDKGLNAIFDQLGREFSAERIRRCLEQEPKQKFPIRRILAIAGTEENPLFERTLAWAARTGIEVTIIVDWRIGGGMFPASSRLADRMGSVIQEHDMLPAWHDAVFTGKQAVESPEAIIVSAPDPLAECEWALRRCQELMKDGEMPGRMAIFARDGELYGPLIHASATRFGVPLSSLLTIPLLSSGFARTIAEAVRVVAGNDVRDLNKLSRSSYLGTSVALRLELETALAEARRAGDDQWKRAEEWAEENHERLPWLAELLAWRTACLDKPVPLAGWMARLRELPDKLDMIKHAVEDESTMLRDKAALHVLPQSLGDISLLSGMEGAKEHDLAAFTRIALDVWDEARISLKTNDGGVRFVTSTESLSGSQTILALGMLEGSFPRRRAEDPLITDADIAELRELSGGRVDLPDSFERAAQERDEFIRLISTAEKSLWLSIPQADESQDNIPAFYLDELERALGTAARRVYSRAQFAPAEEDCLNRADLNLSRALAGPRETLSRPEIQSEEVRNLASPAEGEPISIDELQDALACPFRAVMRHELKVSSQRRRSLSGLLINVPMIAGLATAPTEVEAREQLVRAVEQVLEKESPHLDEWQIRLLKSASERWIPEWIEREFLARQLWTRGLIEDRPRLGQPSLPNQTNSEGHTLRFSGEASAGWLNDDFRAVTLWMGDSPEQVNEDEDWAKEDRLKIGLWLMAMYGGKAPRSAVEADSPDGPRRLYYFGDGPLPNRRQAGPCKVIRVGDSPAMFRQVRGAWTEAMRRLRKGDARPTPAESACQNCAYGELCRSSSEFGETTDLFERSEE